MIAAWIVSMPPNMLTRSWATTSSSLRSTPTSFPTWDVREPSGACRQRASSPWSTPFSSPRAASASRCGSGLPS